MMEAESMVASDLCGMFVLGNNHNNVDIITQIFCLTIVQMYVNETSKSNL